MILNEKSKLIHELWKKSLVTISASCEKLRSTIAIALATYAIDGINDTFVSLHTISSLLSF